MTLGSNDIILSMPVDSTMNGNDFFFFSPCLFLSFFLKISRPYDCLCDSVNEIASTHSITIPCEDFNGSKIQSTPKCAALSSDFNEYSRVLGRIKSAPLFAKVFSYLLSWEIRICFSQKMPWPVLGSLGLRVNCIGLLKFLTSQVTESDSESGQTLFQVGLVLLKLVEIAPDEKPFNNRVAISPDFHFWIKEGSCIPANHIRN